MSKIHWLAFTHSLVGPSPSIHWFLNVGNWARIRSFTYFLFFFPFLPSKIKNLQRWVLSFYIQSLLVVKWMPTKGKYFKKFSLCIWEQLSWQNFTLNMGGLYKSGRCLFGIVHFCKTPQIWKTSLHSVRNSIEALPGHLGPSHGENIVSFLMWRQRSGPKLVILANVKLFRKLPQSTKCLPDSRDWGLSAKGIGIKLTTSAWCEVRVVK